MMQAFVKGSDKALKLYQNVFDAKLLCSNSDGIIMHSELDVCGQILAISELIGENTMTGSTMMFCLHFGEGKEAVVQKIYSLLKDGAKIIYPLSKCDYSSLNANLIDYYGVHWCIFVKMYKQLDIYDENKSLVGRTYPPGEAKSEW